MRITPFALALVLALGPSTVAAQSQSTATPPQKPAAPSEPIPDFVPAVKNIIDFGARGTSLSGDGARYERYRDLGDGVFLDAVRFNRETDSWVFDASGSHVGRRDQRLAVRFGRPGTVMTWGLWDQIPMLMSRSTQTLYVEDLSKAPGTLTIDDALQTAVQASTAALPALFAANARTFTTDSQRHIGLGGVEYRPVEDLSLRAQLRVTTRKGVLPYGSSFGHSSLVEIPAPIDHRLTDLETSAEVTRGAFLLRASANGSWFHNNETSVTFDNPFRATDVAATPSRGRSSLAPSNSFVSVNGLVSVKLPAHSRATAYVSMGSLKDAGDPMLAQTINTAITNLTALPRTTVDGQARTTAMNLSFVTRPNRYVDVQARYKLYDYDNRTPEFILPQRVAYDNTPGAATFSTLGGATSPLVVETEPFGIRRETADIDLRLHVAKAGTAAVGYSHLSEDRTHRFFEDTTENVARVSYDILGAGTFSVRTKYEHGAKRGTATDEAARELFNIGEQPGIRQFDIASRDRDRVTLLASVSPGSAVSLFGSVAAGKDDYIESTFGLRDNTHRVLGAGVDLTPSDQVTMGVSYAHERYIALSRSRQANPPAATAAVSYETYLQLSAQPSSTVQIADATRNWAAEGADRVHSVIAHLDVTGLQEKWDFHLNYDFNRARALYTYSTGPNIPRTLPEDVTPPTSTLPDPSQLPLIRSDLHRGTFDALYALTPRVSVGISYWYERYRVADFTLDADANQDLARGQALLLGYMYRPYTANTVWARVVTRF